MTLDLGPTDDQETVIQWHRDEDTAHVYTCDATMITRFKKNPLAVLVDTHKDQQGRITGYEFDLPLGCVMFATKKRRGYQRSPEQRAAAAAVFEAMRRKRSGHPRVRQGEA